MGGMVPTKPGVVRMLSMLIVTGSQPTTAVSARAIVVVSGAYRSIEIGSKVGQTKEVTRQASVIVTVKFSVTEKSFSVDVQVRAI